MARPFCAFSPSRKLQGLWSEMRNFGGDRNERKRKAGFNSIHLGLRIDSRIESNTTVNSIYQPTRAPPPRSAPPPNRSFSSGQQTQPTTTVDRSRASAELGQGGHWRAMADQSQPALLERIPHQDDDRPSPSDVAAPPAAAAAATFPPSPVQAPQASTSNLKTPTAPSMVRTRSGLGTVDAQVYGVVCVGFDHALGPNIEFAYPDALADNHDLNKNLPFLALPDGAHAVRDFLIPRPRHRAFNRSPVTL